MQSNQAGIAAVKRPALSAAYQSQYLNPDLSTKSAVLVYPLQGNALGLSFESYGFSAYNEQKASFSYAKNFGGKLFAALAFNYHQVKIPQYGDAKAYSFEAGAQYFLSENLLLGAHLANPSSSKYSNQLSTVIPSIYEVGASYRVSNKLLLNSGLVKELELKADFRSGLEYQVIDWLAFRGGVSANPFRQYAGFGLLYNNFRIDAAVATHPDLGISPQIALSYEF
ncbi:MAG: hypothetical protein K0S09_2655 [Sphingobacteriaceae bacterium]|nr:hypothetical protein [Sphingobacteriaceae bacterium]